MNDSPRKDDELIDLIQSNWLPDESCPDQFTTELGPKLTRARRTSRAATACLVTAALFMAVLWSRPDQETTPIDPSQHNQQALTEDRPSEPTPLDPYWDSELSESTERDAWPEPYQDLAALVLPDL